MSNIPTIEMLLKPPTIKAKASSSYTAADVQKQLDAIAEDTSDEADTQREFLLKALAKVT